MSNWIEIHSYAHKYGISVSTLRRRIRSKTITFRMEKGKYLLEDSPEVIAVAPLYARTPTQQSAPNVSAASVDANILEENRRLKEQVSELQTLVKVLEAELDAR